VDISPKNLDWGRANLKLNGFDSMPHEVLASDATDFIKRARRQKKSYDLIIVDPPTFAHGRRRKNSFSILRDLPEMIAGVASILRPGGIMMISTNHRRVTMAKLREQLKAGAEGRRYEVIATPRLPLDFSVDPDHAKTLFAQFD
jgi:23S rRNA G2069 N7-methylase RlmK/C1962 C5-methylase RlmI